MLKSAMQHLAGALWMLLLLAAAATADETPGREGPPVGGIADLAWLTGDWEGPFGDGAILQETWLEPAGNAMVGAVRVLEGARTAMIELIVIEESEGSLVFRLQQWSKAFEPRLPVPQRMVLAELGENRVRFVADDESVVFRSLTYSRPEAESFVIQLEMREPPMSQEIKLRPR